MKQLNRAELHRLLAVTHPATQLSIAPAERTMEATITQFAVTSERSTTEWFQEKVEYGRAVHLGMLGQPGIRLTAPKEVVSAVVWQVIGELSKQPRILSFMYRKNRPSAPFSQYESADPYIKVLAYFEGKREFFYYPINKAYVRETADGWRFASVELNLPEDRDLRCVAICVEGELFESSIDVCNIGLDGKSANTFSSHIEHLNNARKDFAFSGTSEQLKYFRLISGKTNAVEWIAGQTRTVRSSLESTLTRWRTREQVTA